MRLAQPVGGKARVCGCIVRQPSIGLQEVRGGRQIGVPDGDLCVSEGVVETTDRHASVRIVARQEGLQSLKLWIQCDEGRLGPAPDDTDHPLAGRRQHESRMADADTCGRFNHCSRWLPRFQQSSPLRSDGAVGDTVPALPVESKFLMPTHQPNGRRSMRTGGRASPGRDSRHHSPAAAPDGHCPRDTAAAR